MQKFYVLLLTAVTALSCMTAQAQYVPSEDNLQARRDFESFRFGIFIHWGIYSEFAQGEWYLETGRLDKDEYAKAASCFYPLLFDARQWVSAIKQSGAKYITFTSRHHDGFSMFDTALNDYNIVKATPFGRDVVRELADACHDQGIRLHLYYSILDWIRDDYPIGRTGQHTGRTPRPDYDSYYDFMKGQVHELLTSYQDIGGIWLDGYWDHDQDSVPFDWRMQDFYRYIHQIKPSCLIGNNHHITPIEGEDFQMFERDLPGENTAGLSGQEVSKLPLEMCQTMNGMWGYKVADQNYKTTRQLVELIVRAAAKGSNLLLNIGPQPNGQLPETALKRLQGIGQWMDKYGNSIYGTHPTDIPEQSWGVTTQRGNSLFVHVLNPQHTIQVPLHAKPRMYRLMDGTRLALPVTYDKKRRMALITMPDDLDKAPQVIEIVR